MIYLETTPVIVGLHSIRNGGVPLTSKTPAHAVVRVQTEDGPMDVCISDAVAVELAEALLEHFQ
jgi:hypothetical protein